MAEDREDAATLWIACVSFEFLSVSAVRLHNGFTSTHSPADLGWIAIAVVWGVFGRSDRS